MNIVVRMTVIQDNIYNIQKKRMLSSVNCLLMFRL